MERDAGKRGLTGTLGDERDPRPSLAMETDFGPRAGRQPRLKDPGRSAHARRSPHRRHLPGQLGGRGVTGNPLTWTCSFSMADDSCTHCSPVDFPAQVAAPHLTFDSAGVYRSGVTTNLFLEKTALVFQPFALHLVFLLADRL